MEVRKVLIFLCIFLTSSFQSTSATLPSYKLYKKNSFKNVMRFANRIPEIDNYLIKQKEKMRGIMDNGQYKFLVELGCFDGRNSVVVNNHSYYVGIDLDSESICKAKKNYSEENKLFICGDCYSILSCFSFRDLTLVVFPFNLFGNMVEKERENILCLLKVKKIDFVIFSYQDNPYTINIRERYYRSCFEDIQPEYLQNNSVFYSPTSGFRSKTFAKEYYKNISRIYSYRMYAGNLSSIGTYFFYKKKRNFSKL